MRPLYESVKKEKSKADEKKSFKGYELIKAIADGDIKERNKI